MAPDRYCCGSLPFRQVQLVALFTFLLTQGFGLDARSRMKLRQAIHAILWSYSWSFGFGNGQSCRSSGGLRGRGRRAHGHNALRTIMLCYYRTVVPGTIATLVVPLSIRGRRGSLFRRCGPLANTTTNGDSANGPLAMQRRGSAAIRTCFGLLRRVRDAGSRSNQRREGSGGYY